MSREIFIDTHYLLGLLNPADQWHRQAVAAAATVEGRCVTTEAVLIELANALCNTRHREIAVNAIGELRIDPDVECVPVDRALFDRAFTLYQQRRDKNWSLTDCISFVVMAERELEAALTGDHHFEQAGFRALLRA